MAGTSPAKARPVWSSAVSQPAEVGCWDAGRESTLGQDENQACVLLKGSGLDCGSHSTVLASNSTLNGTERRPGY